MNSDYNALPRLPFSEAEKGEEDPSPPRKEETPEAKG